MTEKVLKCDMSAECDKVVTHIDDHGFIYCANDGETRKQTRGRCRKLRPHELNRLKRGEQVRRY